MDARLLGAVLIAALGAGETVVRGAPGTAPERALAACADMPTRARCSTSAITRAWPTLHSRAPADHRRHHGPLGRGRDRAPAAPVGSGASSAADREPGESGRAVLATGGLPRPRARPADGGSSSGGGTNGPPCSRPTQGRTTGPACPWGKPLRMAVSPPQPGTPVGGGWCVARVSAGTDVAPGCHPPLTEQIGALNDFGPLLGRVRLGPAPAHDAQRAGALRISPQTVMSASEVLTRSAAQIMAEAWRTAPYDVYAATETAGIASPCVPHPAPVRGPSCGRAR